MNNLKIETVDSVLVVDSRLIAEELGIDHKSFMKNIQRYEKELLTFDQIRFAVATVTNSTGAVNEVKFVYLTEEQATFVMTLSRNTEEVVKCKLELVIKFSEAKKQILKPMSPAELIIAQGQAMLALEQKQAALELEQKRLSEAMIQQAVQIEVSRVLAEKTAAQVEVHDKAIDSLTADIQALKAILAAPVPTCNQTLRQKIVETTQILGSALVKKGVYKTHPEAMREVWGRLMLKIKSSSARKNIPLLKTNLEKQYVKDMEEYNQKKALGIKVSKPLKKDYFKNNAEWIQDLNLEQIAYNCIMSVIQDFMGTLAMVV